MSAGRYRVLLEDSFMDFRAYGSPGRYLQGPGIITLLPDLLTEYSARRPLLVADGFVRSLVEKAIPDLNRTFPDMTWVDFQGECTAAEIDRIAAISREKDCDVIVGLGGGKAIDAAKGAQIIAGGIIIIVPTVASTDAPTSRVAVLYDQDHRMEGVRNMRTNPDVVLVDTAILAKAPVRFFVSGIGDALTKRFEAKQCRLARGRNYYGGTPPTMARLVSGQCYRTLLEDGIAAMEAVRRQTPDDAFERVVETTILLSGLSFENGGLSVAHGLVRGLSAVPGLHGVLHGEEVAFGLIVQLLLDEDENREILSEIIPFCKTVGLPLTLYGLGLAKGREQETARLIAERTVATSPHLKHFTRTIEDAELAAAIMTSFKFAGI